MLTPSFEISQDDDYVIIDIKAPFAKVSETEIDFFDRQFRFYSKPYFLRLSLPGRVIQNGDECIKWFAEKNIFHVKVPKVCQGQHFEGLDMITKLLTVSNDMKAKSSFTGIEVVSSDKRDVEEDEDEEHFNWLQSEWTEKDERSLFGERYGFANSYSGVFARMSDELACLVDIKHPEKKTVSARKKERLEMESKQFRDDHYLADLYEQTEIPNLIAIKLPWEVRDCNTEFTDDEKFKLKNLPKKHYLIDKNMKYHLIMGVVDILYSFAYETRVTEGDYSVESGWTITKLSSTICWLELFNSLQETIIACFRRSLCYPLHRNWQLSLKVLEDVIMILEKGRRFVVKCFLRIHSIFNESGDSRYILNDLYITDYCVWLQTVKSTTFSSLAEALKKVKITKDDVELDIVLLEKASLSVLEESENANLEENIELLQRVSVNRRKNHADEESSEEQSDSSSESSKNDHKHDSDTSTSNDESSSDEGSSSESEDETVNVNSPMLNVAKKTVG